jgi:predicted transcriptional regulator
VLCQHGDVPFGRRKQGRLEELLKRNGLLATLQALAQLPSAGPTPTFSYPHICSTLLLIGDSGTAGRTQLSKKLSLGEGTVRTIIRHLTRAGLIRTTKTGCNLTPKGITYYKRIRSKLSKTITVNAGELALDSASMAILVKGAAQRVKQGIEQRDAAVRFGATGACTVLMRRGGLVMPQGPHEWKLDLHDVLAQELITAFHPQDDDVIIIASANHESVAQYAAIAAGLLLVD